jgi:hypothetical protein
MKQIPSSYQTKTDLSLTNIAKLDDGLIKSLTVMVGEDNKTQ